MARRDTINRYLADNVAASSGVNETIGQDPIPPNRIFRITRFGAALPGNGRAELQKKLGPGPSGWKTIAAVIGPGHAQYENIFNIEGGPDSALRIRRVNDDGSPQRIMAWIEGYKNTRV